MADHRPDLAESARVHPVLGLDLVWGMRLVIILQNAPVRKTVIPEADITVHSDHTADMARIMEMARDLREDRKRAGQVVCRLS